MDVSKESIITTLVSDTSEVQRELVEESTITVDVGCESPVLTELRLTSIILY